MTNYPVLIVGAAVGSTTTTPLPASASELAEKLGLFAGLMAVAWYFWQRDKKLTDARHRELSAAASARAQELLDEIRELRVDLNSEREEHRATRDRLLHLALESRDNGRRAERGSVEE